MFSLRKRLDKLEEEVARMKQEANCAEGLHDWQVDRDDCNKPYIRCALCPATFDPKEPSK